MEGKEDSPQRAVKLRRWTIFFEPGEKRRGSGRVATRCCLVPTGSLSLPGGVLAACLTEAETGKFPHQRSARRIRVRKIDDKPRNPKSRDGHDSFRFVLCVKCRHCHIEEVATGSVLSGRNRGVKLQSKVSWRVMQFNSACFKKLVQNEHEFVILLKNSPVQFQ